MIKLHYAPPSIYGRKVLAVLEEKELDFEIVRMSFQTKDHLKPEFLAINPNGEIPALTDDDAVIYESTAIIEYLNDEYPEPPLLPEDSAGRARARMIEDFCDLHLYPALIKCLLKKLKGEAYTDADFDSFKPLVKRLEDYLGKQEYINGAFSLADCAVMAAVATFDGLGLSQAYAGSKLTTYFDRLKKRKGWKGANLLSFETASATA